MIMMMMLISIWINMIVIPCEIKKKKIRQSWPQAMCVKIFSTKKKKKKITEFIKQQTKNKKKNKKNYFLKYCALFYHD